MACSSSGGGSSDSENMTVTEDNQTSADNTTTNVTDPIADLQGTWVTSCAGPDQYGVYRDRSIEVSGTTMIANFTDYSDVCQTPGERLQSTLTNLSIGEQVTLSNGTTGYQFTMTWELQTLTLYDDNAKQVANDNSSCGRTNWGIGKPGDITGINCGDLGVFPPKGTTLYNTYLLTGNNLFTGEQRTDGTYPKSVITDQIHVKQSLTGPLADLQGTWYTIFYGRRCNQNGRIVPCYSETIQFEGSNFKRAILLTDYSSENLDTIAIFNASGSFSILKANSGSEGLFQVDYKLTPTLMKYPELSEFGSYEINSFEVGKETVFQKTYSFFGDNLTLPNAIQYSKNEDYSTIFDQ